MPSPKAMEALIQLLTQQGAKQAPTGQPLPPITGPAKPSPVLSHGSFSPDENNLQSIPFHERMQTGQNIQGQTPVEPRLGTYQLQQWIDDAYGQTGMVTKNQRGYTEGDAIMRGRGSPVTSHEIDPFTGEPYTIDVLLDQIEAAIRQSKSPPTIPEPTSNIGTIINDPDVIPF